MLFFSVRSVQTLSHSYPATIRQMLTLDQRLGVSSTTLLFWFLGCFFLYICGMTEKPIALIFHYVLFHVFSTAATTAYWSEIMSCLFQLPSSSTTTTTYYILKADCSSTSPPFPHSAALVCPCPLLSFISLNPVVYFLSKLNSVFHSTQFYVILHSFLKKILIQSKIKKIKKKNKKLLINETNFWKMKLPVCLFTQIFMHLFCFLLIMQLPIWKAAFNKQMCDSMGCRFTDCIFWRLRECTSEWGWGGDDEGRKKRRGSGVVRLQPL